MRATRTDLAATPNGIPRCVGPLDFRFVTHSKV
jgi:hypothetical protein